jgi:hypothetical protein
MTNMSSSGCGRDSGRAHGGLLGSPSVIPIRYGFVKAFSRIFVAQ